MGNIEFTQEHSYAEKCEITNNSLAFKSITFPQYKGGYYLESYGIMFEKKPKCFHRFFMRVLLGFKWKDNESTL